MALTEFRRNPSRRELRWFALCGAVCIGGAAVTVVRRGAGDAAMGAVVASAIVLASVGLLAPQRLRRLYVVWMAAAFPVGWLVSLLLLAVVYYGVVTPIGLALRLTGRDPLRRSFDRTAATYWLRREPTSDGRRDFRQF